MTKPTQPPDVLPTPEPTPAPTKPLTETTRPLRDGGATAPAEPPADEEN